MLTPGSTPWPLPLVPHFAPQVVVTDVGGQLHVYGPPAGYELMARAPYDQFFSSDYSAMIHDANGCVVTLCGLMTQGPLCSVAVVLL